jgi:hypothetical protein
VGIYINRSQTHECGNWDSLQCGDKLFTGVHDTGDTLSLVSLVITGDNLLLALLTPASALCQCFFSSILTTGINKSPVTTTSVIIFRLLSDQ